MLLVKKQGDGSFEVTVSDRVETTHLVTLEDAYYQKLTDGKETPELLIERSFKFLLRNEPNTSILRSFNLKEINRYFPNYEKEMVAGGE